MSLNSKRGIKSPDFLTVDLVSRHAMCANEAARTRAGRCVFGSLCAIQRIRW